MPWSGRATFSSAWARAVTKRSRTATGNLIAAPLSLENQDDWFGEVRSSRRDRGGWTPFAFEFDTPVDAMHLRVLQVLSSMIFTSFTTGGYCIVWSDSARI